MSPLQSSHPPAAPFLSVQGRQQLLPPALRTILPGNNYSHLSFPPSPSSAPGQNCRYHPDQARPPQPDTTACQRRPRGTWPRGSAAPTPTGPRSSRPPRGAGAPMPSPLDPRRLPVPPHPTQLDLPPGAQQRGAALVPRDHLSTAPAAVSTFRLRQRLESRVAERTPLSRPSPLLPPPGPAAGVKRSERYANDRQIGRAQEKGSYNKLDKEKGRGDQPGSFNSGR